MSSPAENPAPVVRFRVKYYDANKSRRGQGVQVRDFHDRVAAETFASHSRLYGKPCRVQEVSS